jgi:hypothetical protein
VLGRVGSIRARPLAAEPRLEVLLEFPKPLEPTRAIRSTLITSSLTSLRARGLFERYLAAQTSPHRQTILQCVAGEWLSEEVGAAHYRACDALGLPIEQQIAIGKDVSRRLHETLMNVVVKVARSVGVTPWTLLVKGNVMQSRLYRGGGVRVTRLAQKSAKVELGMQTLLEIPYYRHALLGVYTAAVELLGSQVTARVLSAESREPGQLLALRIDWQ